MEPVELELLIEIKEISSPFPIGDRYIDQLASNSKQAATLAEPLWMPIGATVSAVLLLTARRTRTRSLANVPCKYSACATSDYEWLTSRLYTEPRTTAVTQPKTRLNPMPSIQTLTDVIGDTENREIHAVQPCEAGKSGKSSAAIKQIRKRMKSAAESPHPRAAMLSWVFAAVCTFIAALHCIGRTVNRSKIHGGRV